MDVEGLQQMLARSQMLLKGEKKSPDNVVWDKKNQQMWKSSIQIHDGFLEWKSE